VGGALSDRAPPHGAPLRYPLGRRGIVCSPVRPRGSCGRNAAPPVGTHPGGPFAHPGRSAAKAAAAEDLRHR